MFFRPPFRSPHVLPPLSLTVPLIVHLFLFLQTGLKPGRVPTRKWHRSTGDWTATGARPPKRRTAMRRRGTRWMIPKQHRKLQWWRRWLASTLNFDQSIAYVWGTRQPATVSRADMSFKAALIFACAFCLPRPLWVARRTARHEHWSSISCLCVSLSFSPTLARIDVLGRAG